MPFTANGISASTTIRGCVLGAELQEGASMRHMGQFALNVTCTLACVLGLMPVAARLAGAGQGVLEQAGYSRDQVDEEVIRPYLQKMREALGETAFEAAFAADRALPYPAALVEVRTWLASNESRAGAKQ
jgi:hypothetical protein